MKEFLRLNVNIDMIIKTCENVRLNIKIVRAIFNILMLKMIINT